MATYITLFRFTQQGIENIKESPSRLERAKEAIRAAGGEMKAYWRCSGISTMRLRLRARECVALLASPSPDHLP